MTPSFLHKLNIKNTLIREINKLPTRKLKMRLMPSAKRKLARKKRDLISSPRKKLLPKPGNSKKPRRELKKPLKRLLRLRKSEKKRRLKKQRD